MDIFELKPSGLISQNEIDAAKLVHSTYLNVQGQPQLIWPTSYIVARAYIDQLNRNNGLSRDYTTAISNSLTQAEHMRKSEQNAALTKLATQVDADVTGAADPAKVRMLAAEIRSLAAM